MSLKNCAILISCFLIFAAVSPAPAAQATQQKNNQQLQQDRTNNANRKQWSNQTESKSQMQQVQTALKSRGFDPGPIDGIMGPKTMMAIRNFQSSQAMTASGMVDDATLAALQIKSQTGSTSAPLTSGNVGKPRLPQQQNPMPQA